MFIIKYRMWVFTVKMCLCGPFTLSHNKHHSATKNKNNPAFFKPCHALNFFDYHHAAVLSIKKLSDERLAWQVEHGVGSFLSSLYSRTWSANQQWRSLRRQAQTAVVGYGWLNCCMNQGNTFC